MSEKKLSLLEKRIAQFAESTAELLTDIHDRNKGGNKGTLKKNRRKQKTSSTPNPDMDALDEEPAGL